MEMAWGISLSSFRGLYKNERKRQGDKPPNQPAAPHRRPVAVLTETEAHGPTARGELGMLGGSVAKLILTICYIQHIVFLMIWYFNI